MLKHVDKGCYSDPLPPHEMSSPIDPSDPDSEMFRRRSTSQIESVNMLMNNMVSDVSRMTAELGCAKIWIRATRYNLSKDKKLQKLLGIEKPRSMNWYFHEPADVELEQEPEMAAANPSPTAATITELLQEPEMTSVANASSPTATMMMTAPISNKATSAATPSQKPLPQPLLVSPSPFKTKADFYHPQATWNRKLTKIDRPTAHNTYLPEYKPLTVNQNALFWNIVGSVNVIHGMNVPPKRFHEFCAGAWNALHFQSIESGNGIGLGGLVRPSFVSKILGAKGRQIRSHQCHQNSDSKSGLITGGSSCKRLFREQIDKLSHRDCGPWLVLTGGPKANDLQKRRKALHDYFQAHPKIQYLQL